MPGQIAAAVWFAGPGRIAIAARLAAVIPVAAVKPATVGFAPHFAPSGVAADAVDPVVALVASDLALVASIVAHHLAAAVLS